MNFVSLEDILHSPFTIIAGVSFALCVAGTVLMKVGKNRDEWTDMGSILQGGGGSIFIAIIVTVYMSSNNLVN
jgi:hypothetical protein